MRRTFLPYLALAAVLLAGCSGRPAPKEPDSTGSASPEATATPPPLPEAATQETTEGAEAFVEHYVAVLTYSAQSGDTALLRASSTPDCAGCASYADRFEQRRDAGGWRVGGAWTTADLQVSQFGVDIAIVTELKSAAGTVKEDAAATPQKFDAATEVVTFVSAYVDGTWIMQEFALGDQS